jgi:hypothetical protein
LLYLDLFLLLLIGDWFLPRFISMGKIFNKLLRYIHVEIGWKLTLEYTFLIDKLFHYSEVNTKCFDEGLPLTCLSIIIVNWNTELSLTSLLCLIHIIFVVKLRNAYSQNWKEILLAIVNYKNFKAVANNLKFVDSLFLFYHLH